MKRFNEPVLIIFLIVLGVVLSNKWFSTPTKENKESNSKKSDIKVDESLVKTTEDLVKNYTKSDTVEMPSLDKPKDIETKDELNNVSTLSGDMGSFYNLFYGVIGKEVSQSKSDFDGTYGKGVLEIYNSKALGLYKFRYVYEESATNIVKGIELSYAVSSGDLNVDTFYLNEINKILQGSSMEPYVSTRINNTLTDYRKIAQVNGISVPDSKKVNSEVFTVGKIPYTVSTIGNIITISAIYSIPK